MHTPTLLQFLLHNWYFTVPLIIALAVLVGYEIRSNKSGGMNLTPANAIRFINQNHSQIIDIRSPEAYAHGHIARAQHFDYNNILKNPQVLQKHKTRPILVVCDRGVRSLQIANALKKQGFESVCSLQGGMTQWQKENLPTTTR